MREAQHALAIQSWFVNSGMAAGPSVSKLNEWIPEEKDLQAYLDEVRGLLATLSDKIAAKSKLGEEHKSLYRQIVFTAAWQESCWRQYITPWATTIGISKGALSQPTNHDGSTG